MLWALTSAKGSPGVTTTALALVAAAAAGAASAARAPGRVRSNGTSSTPADTALLVELDPAGGDLECWCGPHGEPGLLRAVADLRDRTAGERLALHALEVVPGARGVLAPTTDGSVTAALRSAADGFADAVGAFPGRVVVDLGRWVTPAPVPASRLVADAAAVVVVCRSALASVEHTRALVAALQAVNRRVAVVMVGGDRPYSAGEVAAVVRAPVVGVLPWDPRGVTALVERGATRPWARSALASATSELAASLDQIGMARHPGWTHV